MKNWKLPNLWAWGFQKSCPHAQWIQVSDGEPKHRFFPTLRGYATWDSHDLGRELPATQRAEFVDDQVSRHTPSYHMRMSRIPMRKTKAHLKHRDFCWCHPRIQWFHAYLAVLVTVGNAGIMWYHGIQMKWIARLLQAKSQPLQPFLKSLWPVGLECNESFSENGMIWSCSHVHFNFRTKFAKIIQIYCCPFKTYDLCSCANQKYDCLVGFLTSWHRKLLRSWIAHAFCIHDYDYRLDPRYPHGQPVNPQVQ